MTPQMESRPGGSRAAGTVGALGSATTTTQQYTTDPRLDSAIQSALYASGGKLKGDELWAVCPSCGASDHHFSYNVTSKMAACFKCDWGKAPGEGGAKALAALMGMELPRSPSSGHSSDTWKGQPIIAVYPYEDENGTRLFEVCRVHMPDGSKEFPVRKPYGGSWGIKGIRRGLFNLPALLAADPAVPVYIVEGEKDTLNLAARGLLAVCNPGGAKKWREEYSACLRSRSVAILYDNDDDGRTHRDMVIESLRGIAGELRVVELPGLPPKGDVTDWFDQGHDEVELGNLAAATPPLEAPTAPAPAPPPPARCMAYHADDLLDALLPEPRFLVRDRIPEGLIILAGRPKMGKSWLALLLASAMGTGGYFLGILATKGKVAYLALEDPPKRMKKRMKVMDWPRGATVDFFFNMDPIGGTLDGLPAFMEAGEYDLVIIDTLSRAMPVGVRTNDNAEMVPVLGPIQQAAVQQGRAVLVIDHYRKAGLRSEGGDHLDEVMNATTKVAVADTIIGLARKRGEREAILKITGRDFEDDLELAIEHDRDTGSWELLGNADDVRRTQTQKKALATLKALAGQGVTQPSTKEVQEASGIGKGHTSEVLHELAEAGKVRRLPRDGKEQRWQLVD